MRVEGGTPGDVHRAVQGSAKRTRPRRGLESTRAEALTNTRTPKSQDVRLVVILVRLSTHDPKVMAPAHRVVHLADGRIVG
jgi:hypothetical protein